MTKPKKPIPTTRTRKGPQKPPEKSAAAQAHAKALAKLEDRYKADIEAARAVHEATYAAIKAAKLSDARARVKIEYGDQYERADRQCKAQHTAAATRFELSRSKISYFYFRSERPAADRARIIK